MDKIERKHDRSLLASRIRMIWEDNGIQELKSRDVSDGGVFLELGEGPVPPIGTQVTLQVIDNLIGDDAPLVPAIVVRIAEDGFGVEFDF